MALASVLTRATTEIRYLRLELAPRAYMSSMLANKVNQGVIGLLCGGLMLLASGCATSAASNLPNSVAVSSPNATSTETAPGQQFEHDDSAALDKLWKARLLDLADGSSSDGFVLGPGDLLRISVPPIEPRTVRVSEGDTIAMPLLGEINVAGMTEDDLRAALKIRMAKYRYHPEVSVFIEKPEDRQVAVLGAVKTPGRYMLASRSDTLMTVISRAGGITDGAASQIFLMPAPVADLRSGAAKPRIQLAAGRNPTLTPILAGTDGAEGEERIANTATRPLGELGPLPNQQDEELFAIDMSQPEGQRYLEIPARPGDVILVPPAGEVTVQGWVNKPGSFKVTPKMTALNAIAAAGGAIFSSSATLLREKPDGGKQAMALDISKMKKGDQLDPPVEGGDVIIVDRSVLGALPYAAYFIVEHTGLGVMAY
jgi:polysaccharide biosynthesis/export protein